MAALASSLRDREHADRFLASVQSLRTENLAFDFFIHVKETLFPVHKLVLISFSNYFRAMLLNDNFKETKEGKVELKSVEENAVKEAVEYMYTGNCSVDLENVSAVLKCAHMLQIEGVEDISFQYIKESVSDKNCVFFLHIVTIYPNKSALDAIEEYFCNRFFDVGTSDDFMQLEYADASKYIHEYGLRDIEAWKVGLEWVNHDITIRERHIFEIAKQLRLVDYPSHELLKCMWEERIFKECPECVDFIHHRLFLDISDLKQNIETDNCIFLLQQARDYKHDNANIRESIIEFMKNHLGELMALSDFSYLHKDDVKVLVLADDTNYLSETTKWSAIHEWMKINSSDTDIFVQLFEGIHFNHIPIGFINNNIIDNPLIKKLCCYKDVLRRVCERHIPSAHSIAVLVSGNLYIIDMLTDNLKPIGFPSGCGVGHEALISVNGKLCLILGHTVYYRTRGHSWMKLMDIPDFHLNKSITAVVDLNDCIYILNKDETYMYSPISNDWSSTCGCGFDAFTATSSNNYLYALSKATGTISRFNPASGKWTTFCSVDDKDLSSIVYVGGELYVTNGTKWMQYSTVSDKWIQKVGFASNSSQFKNLIAIGDKALFLSSSSSTISIHTLDVSCGVSSQKSFSNKSNTHTYYSSNDITAACAFRTSEADQASQHSKRLKLI